MLIISAQVMAAFEAQQRQVFVEKAVNHASLFDPGGFGALDIAARRRFVLDTIDVADRFGIAGQNGTILLLEARCVHGPAFPSGDEHAWACNLLASQWSDETRTMEYVRDTAMFKARERGRSTPATGTSHA